MENNQKTFKELYELPTEGHIESKSIGNGVKLSYLSWAYAWATLIEQDQSANYKIHKNEQGFNYFSDGKTAFVETEVSAFGKTIEQELPVMDNRNHSIPSDSITSFDINTSIQRCLTKNIAMFGIGLKIYAGEDLPTNDESEEKCAETMKPAPLKTESPKDDSPTASQLAFAKSLMLSKNISEGDLQQVGANPNPKTRKEASALIDFLRAAPTKAKPKEESNPDDDLPF